MTSTVVAWHDIECHGYDEDMPRWLELAEREAGPILDVGAGTGRVAIPLADAGYDVTALDLDADLLAELDRRAEGRIRTVQSDARAFALGPFGLILVPMQTLQLLDDRAGFWRSAKASLAPGGLVAAAIADELVAFDDPDFLPDPDVGDFDGVRYVSQPIAVRVDADRARIERIRTVDGRFPEADAIELAIVDPAGLAREARAAGLTPVPGDRIAATDEHVGSSVVMARC